MARGRRARVGSGASTTTRRFLATPRSLAARRMTASSPTRMQRALGLFAAATTATSGPTPLGQPMLMARVTRFTVLASRAPTRGADLANDGALVMIGRRLELVAGAAQG